jgi:hypothetical protein
MARYGQRPENALKRANGKNETPLPNNMEDSVLVHEY